MYAMGGGTFAQQPRLVKRSRPTLRRANVRKLGTVAALIFETAGRLATRSSLLAWPLGSGETGVADAGSNGMHRLAKHTRLTVCGISASALVFVAGIVANFGGTGIASASALLTTAAIVALAGWSYAKDRSLGTAVLGLIAAALPLFLGFYAAGLAVLKMLGQAASSLLLIAASIAIATFTLIQAQEWRHRAPR
jgi:hypothetical protein